MKKYLLIIQKEEKKLIKKLKEKGISENFGQDELRKFNDKINACIFLSYGEKAELSNKFSEMVDIVNDNSSQYL